MILETRRIQSHSFSPLGPTSAPGATLPAPGGGVTSPHQGGQGGWGQSPGPCSTAQPRRDAPPARSAHSWLPRRGMAAARARVPALPGELANSEGFGRRASPPYDGTRGTARRAPPQAAERWPRRRARLMRSPPPRRDVVPAAVGRFPPAACRLAALGRCHLTARARAAQACEAGAHRL